MWVFNFVKKGLMYRSFQKLVKSCLKSDMLSNTALRGHEFLLSHILFNNWLTLVDDLSIYSPLLYVASLKSNVGTLMISNQPVAGSIIVMQVILALFLMISPPLFCCLISLLYLPSRPTCIVSHGFSSVMFLGGRRL